MWRRERRQRRDGSLRGTRNEISGRRDDFIRSNARAESGNRCRTECHAHIAHRRAASPAPQFVATTLYLDQLARAIRETPEPAAQRELIDHAHDTMHELAQDWRPADTLTPEQGTAALIELLVRTRAQLRAAKQFALADQVRQSLGNLGIVLEDTPNGTTWKRMEQK